jgi:hypothetical protein
MGRDKEDMEVHDEAHEHDLVVTPVPSRRGSSPVRQQRKQQQAYGRRQGEGQEEEDEKDLQADTSVEGHERDHDHTDGNAATSPGAKRSGKGEKEFELQDQTNLLPAKQILTVFLGLSMAMICAMLDQTT